MRNLITTIALIALLDSPVAIGQSIESTGSSAVPEGSTIPSSLTRGTQSIGDAPVGHRQPRARDIPSRSSNDLDQNSAEDAAVDRKINNICRGC
jgi:hypothetical protein